jgi:nicotinamidase-related amidase
MITNNTALIIIDVQEGLDHPRYGERNNPDAEANMRRLLDAWRKFGRPIFHIQHMSTEPTSMLRPELPGNAIKAIVAPQNDEPVIQKNVNSAFIGTDLEDRLRAAGIETVVMAGLTTNHCVSTSVRMAANLGFKTYVVADATAAHAGTGYDGKNFSAEEMHISALASLHGEFATVVETEKLLS